MAELDSFAYLLGRSSASFVAPYQGRDLAYGGVRLDGSKIADGDFAHCTFANVSFKEAVITNGRFVDCAFIGCYFRRAELINSHFVGCRFVDCNFSHVAVKSCGFRYSSFRGCQLPYSELRHSFPSEPNVREELARDLALESSRLGLSSEARRYRMAEIQAREAHLRAAAMGDSQWYREHFDGPARIRAAAQLALSLANRWLWGYGERVRVLVVNLAVLGFLIFPAAYWWQRDDLVRTTRSSIRVQDAVYFSLQNILPAGIQSDVTAVGLGARLVAGLESVFGVVALALMASYVFRWSLHR